MNADIRLAWAAVCAKVNLAKSRNTVYWGAGLELHGEATEFMRAVEKEQGPGQLFYWQPQGCRVGFRYRFMQEFSYDDPLCLEVKVP